ncbi:Peptidoglycan/xylan/chitin deacetylase, PgdA/CDA1 family [Halolactibacillus halophilus]|uniref:Peptidoglycan/xylan/chitin deacetylase, PgdA/CDA1 family n=1 Tax=Halolactibacillus halophilus TaxID=306540 RepID=A0A1I5RI83_9BACI|nr:polysaccharide deacetylase family protein [Halolactibacillus halophilus]GEM02826.1 hypothetical protein HHA03_23580 [Halolactibacillus halophilus]SFP58243.1 Peptidoglycan/xylan/chitin deacetylase, PgdA/CDA1 family [Halolactibacillus halophilus]
MTFRTLMYHEVRLADEFNPDHKSHIDVEQEYNDILPSPLFVTLEQFEQQMLYLYEAGYHTLTIDEVNAFYYEGTSLPEKSVLLTFDDCFQSLRHYTYPVLKKYGFTALSFVVTGWLHNEPKPFNPNTSTCLTESDLTKMTDVFTFCNHTHHFHQRRNETTSIMMTESADAFLYDLATCNSYAVVTEKNVFAYPFGLFNDENMETLKKANFRLSFTTEPGVNTKDTEPLKLHRDVVPYMMPYEGFKQLVSED